MARSARPPVAAEPAPRFAPERGERILEVLQAQGRVEVAALAQRFGVSEHTVRRDLAALQAQGLLRKTHGGAVAPDSTRLGLRSRQAVLPAAKQAMAVAAAALVEPGQTVILDAGSSGLALAAAITARPLTVVTNSLDIARVFEDDPAVQLLLTGGAWDAANRALTGPAALELMRQVRADWAVPGACSVSLGAGITAVHEADAALKRAMVAAARQTLVLADHAKREQVSPFAVADWSQVAVLVTDQPWPTLGRRGVKVIVAA